MYQIDAEHCMRSRGLGIDGGRVCLPNGGSEIQSIEQILDRIDIDLVKSSEQYTAFDILPNGYRGPFSDWCRFGNEQIPQLLVVDLQG